ncbi:MAG: hypothetical protein SVV80_13930, partial [Planctomycetota bacterium]|nr:hypothetical protein [Planctomycetota bacterium]
MAFTGKATYSSGSALPEIAKDVGDIVSIVSPYETPLLDHLGDPVRPASSIASAFGRSSSSSHSWYVLEAGRTG